MRVRVKVDIEKVHVDEVVEAPDEEGVVRELRNRLAARAPFAVKLALRAMSDQALWRRVVEMHNKAAGAQEPVPTDAREFLAFAERAGYVTRV